MSDLDNLYSDASLNVEGGNERPTAGEAESSYNLYEDVMQSNDPADDVFEEEREHSRDAPRAASNDDAAAPTSPRLNGGNTTGLGTDDKVDGNAVSSSLSPSLRAQRSRNPNQQGLYISQLAWWTTDEELTRILEQFGPLQTMRIYSDKTNGKSRGYAYAEFQDSAVTETALQQVNGMRINDKPCAVEISNAAKMRQIDYNYNLQKQRQLAMQTTRPPGVPGRGRGIVGAGAIPPVLPGPTPGMPQLGRGVQPGRGRGGRGQFPNPHVNPHFNPAFMPLPGSYFPMYPPGAGPRPVRGQPPFPPHPFDPYGVNSPAAHLNPNFFPPATYPPGDYESEGYGGNQDFSTSRDGSPSRSKDVDDGRHSESPSRKRRRSQSRSRSGSRGRPRELSRAGSRSKSRSREADRARDREKEKERDRDRDRDRDRQKDKEREKEKEKEKDKDRHRDKDRERDRDRDRDRDKDRERDREPKSKDRDRDRDREKEKDRDRDRERQRDKDKDRDKERDRERERDAKRTKTESESAGKSSSDRRK